MARSAIVIGAGIVGLATARALAVRNYAVTVIEREHRAVGASVRNFGMVWPIGQPSGEWNERAMRSRAIWKQAVMESGIWYDEVGSLHLAYAGDEWMVMQEFVALHGNKGYVLLTREEALQRSANIVPDGLLGALWSPHEMIVDPRQAIAMLPAWLEEKYKVKFLWSCHASLVDDRSVHTAAGIFSADEIYVCSGPDFETLYPSLFQQAPVTKCKLQMLRMAAQPERIGPALCGALSMIHYKGFAEAATLSALQQRFSTEYADYLQHGIHVMVCQNQSGELTIGDSHEYGLTPDPFNNGSINGLILDYLRKFARFERENITSTWNGVYSKMTNGEPALILRPADHVTVINGLGGAGMTLSFGLCDDIVAGKRIVGYAGQSISSFA